MIDFHRTALADKDAYNKLLFSLPERGRRGGPAPSGYACNSG